jgi:sec-independent protein translocase protein TatB
MFDLSWGEMGIIALVALVVLGPKELPNALRTMSTLMKNARKLAGEFQSGVNEIIREADLDEARKKLQEVQSLNKNQIQNAIEKAVDPGGEMKAALTADDPTGPPRTETKPPQATPMGTTLTGTTPAIESGEDDAVEIAAAQPVSLPPSQPASSEPASSDPDVTPAPEPLTKEKT